MILRRLPLLVSFCLLGLLCRTPVIGALAKPTYVKAALVAADATVQPGTPITVALHLSHEPHWHTYWKNPGTGLPTSIEWKLPPGWKAGEIQWPAPQVLKDSKGNILGNGYEGELLLPVVLTPPADLKAGETVILNADADWLMCADVCVPGSASVSLQISVTGAAPKPDATWGDKIRATVAALPRIESAWTVTAARGAKTVTLAIAAVQPGAPEPQRLHFFSDDGLIAYDQPQVAQADGKGGFTLSIPLAADAATGAAKLAGVLISESGWSQGSARRGLLVAAELPAAPASAVGAAEVGNVPAPTGSLMGTLLLAFVGGLILNLMPCVFPVIGIKILGFVNQAGHKRSKVVAHGLYFTGGVLLSFWTLAGVLAVLRAGGDQLGWGFQLQSAAFVYALTVVMLVFGMNMSGVFEFGLGATALVSNAPFLQKPKSNYMESFLTGVLATAVATPCSAPFLAPALGAALAVSTLESFIIFTAIAVGLSTPYLLLSIFPQAVKVLPRPGSWMETFKKIMAFPLYATVGYMVWVLAAQTSEEGFQGVLFSLVLIALAVWMYGHWREPGASERSARFGVISLVVVGALGLWLGWPRSAQAQETGGNKSTAIVWEPWSPETVARLRGEGRIVYVDFTARWCATCQTNKKLVFGSSDVLRTFADKKIATLRADWTNRDPKITAELAAYNRSAVPFNVVWLPGKEKPAILPEILTAGIVLKAVNQP